MYRLVDTGTEARLFSLIRFVFGIQFSLLEVRLLLLVCKRLKKLIVIERLSNEFNWTCGPIRIENQYLLGVIVSSGFVKRLPNCFLLISFVCALSPCGTKSEEIRLVAGIVCYHCCHVLSWFLSSPI